MTNFFDDGEDEFIDNPVSRVDGKWQSDQTNVVPSQPKRTAPTPAPTPPVQVKQQPEEEFELSEFDTEEDYSEVLSDARLRLEQGRLYEMIINNDLFEGSTADPVAARFVQNQIRKFAKEKMEEMLGMRKETAQVERLEIDFPFNGLEINILKKLASTATKGASENADKFVPEVKRTTEEIEIVPRREGLNKISLSSGSKPLPKKLQTKASNPVSRQKPSAQSAVKNLDDDYKPLTKDPSQMTQAELAEHWRQAETRQAGRKTVKSDSAIPPTTFEQEMMLAERHAQAAATPGPLNLNEKLIQIVKNLPAKQ